MYLFSMSLTRRMLGALLAAGAALTMAGTASATEVRRYVDSLGKPVERLYISMIRDAEATEGNRPRTLVLATSRPMGDLSVSACHGSP